MSVKRKKNKSAKKIFFMLLITVLIIFGFYTLSKFDERVFPRVIEGALIIASARLNEMINDEFENIVHLNNIETLDFINKTTDENGDINSLSANTILINKVCSQLAKNMSDRLKEEEVFIVSVPLGVMLGMNTFVNIGPDYNAKVKQAGDVHIEYETEFTSGGINQTNFKVWLKISSRIVLLNYKEELSFEVTRKIAIVNTIINGDVPNYHFPINQ